MNAKMAIRENVEYRLFGKDGKAKKLFQENFIGRFLLKLFGWTPQMFLFGHYSFVKRVSNLVVDAGLAGVMERLAIGVTAKYNYVAIGIGSTAVDPTDTELDSEITTAGGERGAGTITKVTTNVADDTIQWIMTYDFTGSFAVVESGILNDATTGTLFARQVFSAINVADQDTLQITWKTVATAV